MLTRGGMKGAVALAPLVVLLVFVAVICTRLIEYENYAAHQMERYAFVTIIANEAYLDAAMVLGYSLSRQHTRRSICVIDDHMNDSAIAMLLRAGWTEVRPVPLLRSIAGDQGVDLGAAAAASDTLKNMTFTFSKISAWNMTDLEKAVLLDGDMMVLRPITQLLQLPELSVTGSFRSSYFSTAIMILVPSHRQYQELLAESFPSRRERWRSREGNLIRAFFPGRKRLIPSSYNVYHQIRSEWLSAHIYHFRSQRKPWVRWNEHNAMDHFPYAQQLWWLWRYAAEHSLSSQQIKSCLKPWEDANLAGYSLDELAGLRLPGFDCGFDWKPMLLQGGKVAVSMSDVVMSLPK